MFNLTVNSNRSILIDNLFVFRGEDTILNTNESLEPEWRSNYRGDYRGNVRPICTKDLLTWAFQVARGMEYLSSRKVRTTLLLY